MLAKQTQQTIRKVAAVLASINPVAWQLHWDCFLFLNNVPASRQQQAFTYLMVNINYINVQCRNSGIQLHSAAPASPTHRHSAPRPAAPSSETSVLEKGGDRERV